MKALDSPRYTVKASPGYANVIQDYIHSHRLKQNASAFCEAILLAVNHGKCTLCLLSWMVVISVSYRGGGGGGTLGPPSIRAAIFHSPDPPRRGVVCTPSVSHTGCFVCICLLLQKSLHWPSKILYKTLVIVYMKQS